MSKTIQPRLGTVVTMIVAILFLFLLFSQAGKYHKSGFIVEKAEERLALNNERKKAMLYIGVSDDVALKLKPLEIPMVKKTKPNKTISRSSVNKIQTSNIDAAIAIAKNRVKKNKRVSTKKYYTVKRGDSLFGISQKIYGDGNKWRIILKSNTKLTNPNSLRSGMKLIIPEPIDNNTAYIKWNSSSRKRG